MLLNTCNQVDFSILFMHSPVVHVNPRSFPAAAAADHVHPGFYPFPPLPNRLQERDSLPVP